MTGCTFGKGNLIHLDYGKNAFTFIRRSDGKAIRMVTFPHGWGDDKTNAELQDIRMRLNSDQATDADHARFQELQQMRARFILERPLEDIFNVQAVEPVVPAHARIHDSVNCTGCGENVMETRARFFRGQAYCIPCFEARDKRY